MNSTEASNGSSRHGSEYTVDFDETDDQAEMALTGDRHATTKALSSLGRQNASAVPLSDVAERRDDASALATNPEDTVDINHNWE